MPVKDTGPRVRTTRVVTVVGDAKWIWSIMGCITNWLRPLLSGPFPRAALRKQVWIPSVYDREFYRSICQLDDDIQSGNFDVPAGLDAGTMRRQLRFFCKHDLGFNLEFLKYFATEFGWEAVAVGPLHATGTEIKNTYSQWLTLLDCLGLRNEFDRMLRGLQVSKIIARTKSRVNTSGKRVVDSRTSADAGDYINSVMKEGLWSMSHPDVQTEQEFTHNCEMFQCEHTKDALLAAAAKMHGLDVRLFDMLLMTAHLHRELIMTIHGMDEPTSKYLDRVRTYDPTSLTFKDIHGSLFMSESSSQSRWAPSQAYLIYGCREHLFRYAFAGMRYRDSNEGHLEHRHAIRKAFIDICVLHHTGMLPSQMQESVKDDSSHDNVVRANAVKAMRIQLARLVHASNLALRKTSLTSKYKRQFREIDDGCVVPEQIVDEQDRDVATLSSASTDQIISDERIVEMGLGKLLDDALSRPDKDLQCKLDAVECGRNVVEWTRGVHGIHLVCSPSSDSLTIVYSDRQKDRLRGAKRNGSAQKLVIPMGSLWSAWTSTPEGSPARLHLALSSPPACMVRTWTGKERWVRRDEQRVLEDSSTRNIIVLHFADQDKFKLSSVVDHIRQASSKTKTVPVRFMSYRLPALKARAEAYCEEGQQARLPSNGAGLFVRLVKVTSPEERQTLEDQIDVLHQVNLSRWKLYLRTCRAPDTDSPMSSTERIKRQHRLPCMSCGTFTFWDKTSGIRRGLNDKKCHHFCKKLRAFKSDSFKTAPWIESVFRIICNS